MASYRVTDSEVRFRSAPSLSADTLTMLAQGTTAEGTDAPTQQADGHTWRQVTVNGQTGWVAVQFLQESSNGQGGANPGRQFDPSVPDEIQRQDWTCSIRSTMWLLKS